MDLMISKLIVKKGRIEKSASLNISHEEWVKKVKESEQVYFKEELFEWFQGNKLVGAGILSKINLNQYCSLIYDDFWCVIRVMFQNNLESEFIPKLDEFAKSFNAHLLISDTKPYSKEKIESFKNQHKELISPNKMFVENTFGENSAWFAIKGVELERIQQILHIEKIEVTDWDTGVQESYDNKILFIPNIRGWTFVNGFELPSYIHHLYGEFSTEEESLGSVKKVLELLGNNGVNAQFYLNNEKSSVEGAFMAVNGQLKFGYFHAEEYIEKYADFELALDENQGFNVFAVAKKCSINPLDLPFYEEIKEKQVYLANLDF